MEKDPVNPTYYKLKSCDSFDYQTEVCARVPGDEAVCVFNVLKYVTRYHLKNGLEDLNKSKWYLDKLIKMVTNKELESPALNHQEEPLHPKQFIFNKEYALGEKVYYKGHIYTAECDLLSEITPNHSNFWKLG